MEIVKSRWEKEIGMDISEELWAEALKRVNGSTSCARSGLILFKVVHHLHWSRARVRVRVRVSRARISSS